MKRTGRRRASAASSFEGVKPAAAMIRLASMAFLVLGCLIPIGANQVLAGIADPNAIGGVGLEGGNLPHGEDQRGDRTDHGDDRETEENCLQRGSPAAGARSAAFC